ncbi:MAG: glycosyltransferase family 61 protein [Reichenbachiella sp.]|uniref:glycosyltransferase family 61 protein n=1 Tax=Reichenbachiella sp. TaxID=2184521 RepID=UPI002966EDC9|nr:glycosyltransferase family 61 protein [Reichenbachiella sp.]MDW3211697.1 glycosyltransferase family 61 protein [Reichenbachiella sp.]
MNSITKWSKAIRSLLLSIKYHRWNNRLAQKKDILDRPGLLELHKNNIHYFGKDEVIEFNKESFQFINRSESTQCEFFSRILTENALTIPKPFYVRLSNSHLVGHYAVVVQDGKILLESTYNTLFYLRKTGDAKYLMNLRLAKKNDHHFKKAISLVNILDSSYFFWLTNFLPQLEPHLPELLKDTNFKIIVAKKPKRFQIETLHHLGLEKNLFQWDKTHAHVEHLIVPSVLNAHIPYDQYQLIQLLSPRMIHWLRSAFIVNKKEPLKNIYISRAQSYGRQLINEDKLLPYLKSADFERVFLEDLSFSEQVRLFASANNVIATHGAGLINLIFSSNANIIEFFPAKWTLNRSNIFQLSNHLDHRYKFILLDPVNKQLDMKIAIEDMKDIIKKHVR